MTSVATLLPAAAQSLDTELVEVLGAVAAILAVIGLLLVLPIFLGNRREIARLLEWQDREPEAGTTEFRAIPAPAAAPGRSGGKMTPAERVTSERPALSRIATGEYAAIEPEPQGFWQRVVDRGPRHPLVLAILAILIGVGAFVLGSQLIRSDDETTKGRGVDPADVSIAVVNATGGSGVGDELTNRLQRKGFVVDSNTVAPDPEKKSAVLYRPEHRAEGRVVANFLELPDPKPFNSSAEASADGADVVVIAGKDGAATGDGESGGGGGGGGDSGGGG